MGFAHDVEAFALEDEAKQSLLCRPTFADDDPYPSSQNRCLPAALGAYPTPRRSGLSLMGVFVPRE